MEIVREHIKEAFEERDKDENKHTLLFPNEKIVEDSLDNISDAIASICDGITGSGEFKFAFNMKEEGYDNDAILWESEYGAISKVIEYTDIEGVVETEVETEPYEPQTREYPGSPGFWEVNGWIINLKIINNGKVVIHITEDDSETEIYKIINKNFNEVCNRIEPPNESEDEGPERDDDYR